MNEAPPTPAAGDNEPKAMQPLDPAIRRYGSSRRSPISHQQREPIQAFLEASQKIEALAASMEDDPLPSEELPRAAHRQADPIVIYLLLISLAIGLAPLEPLARYMILWTLMAILGAVAYFLGELEAMRDSQLEDLLWGLAFGLVSSFPFLLVLGSALARVSVRMFDEAGIPALVMDSWVFMAVVFVIPLSESLFFRGGMQSVRSLFLTALLGTLWSAVMFFPHMELAGQAVIPAILLIVFGLLNFLYSYVKLRNGLAAAWLCQISSYSLLWFFPRLFFA
jgi:hypothetical protein